MPAGPARGAGRRSAKRTFLAADAAGLDTGAAAAKLKAVRQSLAQFVRETGGRQDSARESVSGFGRSAAGKATWKNRQITNDAAKYFNTGNSGENVAAYLKEKPTIDLLSSHGIKFIYRISDKEILVDAGHPKITDLTGHAADNLSMKADRIDMTMERAQIFVDTAKITLYQCERETLKFIADNGYAVLNFSHELVTAVPQKWRKKYDKYLTRKDVNS